MVNNKLAKKFEKVDEYFRYYVAVFLFLCYLTCDKDFFTLFTDSGSVTLSVFYIMTSLVVATS